MDAQFLVSTDAQFGIRMADLLMWHYDKATGKLELLLRGAPEWSVIRGDAATELLARLLMALELPDREAIVREARA